MNKKDRLREKLKDLEKIVYDSRIIMNHLKKEITRIKEEILKVDDNE